MNYREVNIPREYTPKSCEYCDNANRCAWKDEYNRVRKIIDDIKINGESPVFVLTKCMDIR